MAGVWKLTFEERRTPSEKVKYHALTLPKVHKIREIQAAFVALIILCKDVFKVLRSEATLIVVGHAITSMLVLVEASSIDAEERIGQQARNGRVRQGDIDDEGCE